MQQPIIYLLAGNGSAANWWSECLPYFQHFSAVTLELPGFGDNLSPACESLDESAKALLQITQPGQFIFAVGVNALVVMHLLKQYPYHFKHSFLLAPVGVFLWQRRLPKMMQPILFRKAIHWALSNHPTWFAKRLSNKQWRPEQYQKIGLGYAKCRAFLPSWQYVNAEQSTRLLEWVTSEITLIWGQQDKLLAPKQACAWSAVLARAELNIIFKTNWGHYPWIDSPADFCAWLEEAIAAVIVRQTLNVNVSQTEPFYINAHTKSGRLKLAELAGLTVPSSLTLYRTPKTDQRQDLHVDSQSDSERLPQIDSLSEPLTETQSAAIFAFIAKTELSKSSQTNSKFVVRSSSLQEDHADHANAGLSESVLNVDADNIAYQAMTLLNKGVEEVLIQPQIEPIISGVAFVRFLSAEIEWVNGHLAQLAEGTQTPERVTLSRLSKDWQEAEFKTIAGLTEKKLWTFLQDVIAAFHYVAGDIEWAWDGKQLWLLQYRPITQYAWQRHLTTANIEEILPPNPSQLIDYAQRRTAHYVSHILGKWDTEIFPQNEPFTAEFTGANYINNDLFLAQLYRFGLPSKLYSAEVGGAVPKFNFNLWRFICATPNLLKMLFRSRKQVRTLERQLKRFETELQHLQDQNADGLALANWFADTYLGFVQSNLCIAAALSTSGGGFLGQPNTAYQKLMQSVGSEDELIKNSAPHRLPWETDPATPRAEYCELPLQAFPQWPLWVRIVDRLGLPGMRGYYLQVREWYRDNLMRLFFRLHHAFLDLEDKQALEFWFSEYPIERKPLGSFWQNGKSSQEQANSFAIYNGEVTGILGEDILVEASLDPGRYAIYQDAGGVIALMGGKLSHGSTLLRELRKPSAVIPNLDQSWIGKRVTLKGNILKLV